MLQSLYNGLSGMYSFSTSLDNVSTNISNMNTPGYKSAENFNSQYIQKGSEDNSSNGSKYNLSEGETRDTGNQNDLVIDGEGFFIIEGDSCLHYTRSGSLSFDDSGVLVHTFSGQPVLCIDESGKLGTVNLNDYNTLIPESTSKVNLSGNLSNSDSSYSISDNVVYNEMGESKNISYEFVKDDTSEQWTLQVDDEEGNILLSKELVFDSTGEIDNDLSDFNFTVQFDNGSIDISLEIDSDDGLTNYMDEEGTSISVSSQDGYSSSNLASSYFDDNGVLNIDYENGVSVQGSKLALALFGNSSALQSSDGIMFQSVSDKSRRISSAGKEGIGLISSSKVELSNVELSGEFADMLIIQRGYQASSRVLNVSNQLIEQLYDNTRG